MSSKKNSAVEQLELSPLQTYQAIKLMAPTGRSTFIWGPPGISKSSIIKKFAADQGRPFIDIRLSQMDPTDLRGIPFLTPATATSEAGMQWSAPLILPRDPNSRAVILLDEFNAAPPSVQAGAYQLVLDRQLGEYKVPDGCVIIAAGNRETDKGITYRMPTPIANRFVHFSMKADFDDWQQWALESNVAAEVVGYLSAFKDDLFRFDPSSASRGFETPRTWEFVSDIVLEADKQDTSALIFSAAIAGAIGDGTAYKFIEYRKHAKDLPKSIDILKGKVVKLPQAGKDVSLCYALTTALCYELRDRFTKVQQTEEGKLRDKAMDEWTAECDNFLGFMMGNFRPEVTIMGAKTALGLYKLKFETKKMKNFKAFSDEFKDLIFG